MGEALPQIEQARASWAKSSSSVRKAMTAAIDEMISARIWVRRLRRCLASAGETCEILAELSSIECYGQLRLSFLGTVHANDQPVSIKGERDKCHKQDHESKNKLATHGSTPLSKAVCSRPVRG